MTRPAVGPVAVVVRHDRVRREELRDLAGTRLARSSPPDRWSVLSATPRSATGSPWMAALVSTLAMEGSLRCPTSPLVSNSKTASVRRCFGLPTRSGPRPVEARCDGSMARG